MYDGSWNVLVPSGCILEGVRLKNKLSLKPIPATELRVLTCGHVVLSLEIEDDHFDKSSYRAGRLLVGRREHPFNFRKLRIAENWKPKLVLKKAERKRKVDCTAMRLYFFNFEAVQSDLLFLNTCLLKKHFAD